MPARKFRLYRLIIRDIDNMKQYIIMADLQTDTAEYVKHKLESKTGTPPEAQRLSFRSKVLDDGELKRKHGIGNLRDFEYILQV